MNGSCSCARHMQSHRRQPRAGDVVMSALKDLSPYVPNLPNTASVKLLHKKRR